MTTDAIQGKYILGECTKVGDPRRKHEDRVFSGEVVSKSNISFIVGIVADGVGSADSGERGAQLAIDTAISIIKDTSDDRVADMIERACREANRAVYEENQRSAGDGLTTLVIAVIYKDRCFIGNVGDSRAYWIQGGGKGKMLQLTRDHSYFNIYGGTDPDADDAGILVNAIGRSADVYIDLGFYLDGERGDVDQASRRGLNGLPLKPGDSIVLCSDGLIKDDPMGKRYAEDAEITNAIHTEYETNMAAIKMVSAALGRRPDDNVSAVTMQYLTPKMMSEMKALSASAKRMQIIKRVGSVAFAIIAVLLIAVLGVRAAAKPSQITIIQTTTAMPTATPTKPVDPGKARVDEAAPSSNVQVGQELSPGEQINAGDTSDNGVLIRVGERGEYTGVMYWFGPSTGILDFDESHMMPELSSGAIYVKPGYNKAEVRFSQWTDALATVEGSRMIVEIINANIWIYCFEGSCLFDPGGGENLFKIQPGHKRMYSTQTGEAEDSTEMTDDEKWEWNKKCNNCLADWDGLPTPTPTVAPPVHNPNPSGNSVNNNENNSGGNGVSTQRPIDPPPTDPPPTDPQPTDPPPTDPPPTDPPPTDPPPTDPPPTDPPPTDPPPTDPPPTDPPPTDPPPQPTGDP